MKFLTQITLNTSCRLLTLTHTLTTSLLYRAGAGSSLTHWVTFYAWKTCPRVCISVSFMEGPPSADALALVSQRLMSGEWGPTGNILFSFGTSFSSSTSSSSSFYFSFFSSCSSSSFSLPHLLFCLLFLLLFLHPNNLSTQLIAKSLHALSVFLTG